MHHNPHIPVMHKQQVHIIATFPNLFLDLLGVHLQQSEQYEPGWLGVGLMIGGKACGLGGGL